MHSRVKGVKYLLTISFIAFPLDLLSIFAFIRRQLVVAQKRRIHSIHH